MNLGEIRATLGQREIHLSKSLGQNFLHDRHQLERIVALSELGDGNRVIEIGPGLGALTALLLDRGRTVLGIEKDQRLVAVLRRKFADQPRLEIRHADALDFVRQSPDWSEYPVVSNLPYSVASPLLVELAGLLTAPPRIVVTLQLEVSQRIRARHASDAYGLLTLLVQRRYVPGDFFRIPRTCFFPQPDVDSVCLRLDRRSAPLFESQSQEQIFVRVVKRGFSERRKMMRKLLARDWPEPDLCVALGTAGISEKARAEEISLEQFVIVSKVLGGDIPLHPQP